MSQTAQNNTPQTVRHIGILLGDLGKLNIPVLKYLVLQINSLQQTFEYEFLPPNYSDEFLQKLSNQATANRKEIRAAIPSFLDRYRRSLQAEITDYRIGDAEIPEYFILITLACFNDNYYSLRQESLSILALGNWRHSKVTPSLIEFILTLVVREAVAIVCPPLRGSVHLGTRGCICDFTDNLSDARTKVLSGFVCNYCSGRLEAEGFNQLPHELMHILKKDWLGKPTNPNTPAAIVSNLGYNLFITKGLTTTLGERIKAVLTEEVLKQFIAIIVAILIAYLLLRFGLKQ